VQLVVVPGRPGCGPVPAALLQQPQPHDVAQQADRAVQTAFVGEVQRGRLAPRNGSETSTPSSDQVPEESTASRGPSRGVATNAAAVSCPRQPRPAPRAGAGERRVQRQDPAEWVPGSTSSPAKGAAGSQALDQPPRPASAARIEQAGGGSRRDLVREHARQPQREQVRHQRDALRLASAAPADSPSVEDRVDRHRLDARHRVQLLAAHAFVDTLDHAARALVAVMERQAEQL